MASLLGIDIGTSATKLVLLDPEAGVLATVSEPAGYDAPHPTWAEADADGWWRNVTTGIPRLLALAGRAAEDVLAVGVSGMVPTIVLTDAPGRVLRPSIQQNDARAVMEIEHIAGVTDPDDILRRTGSPVTQQSLAPKLRWLRTHEPDVLARATRVCGSYDLIVQRLTGTWSVERNWALESGLYDLVASDWDDALLSLATIDRGWLPTVRRPSDVVGEVTPAAAAATGLRQARRWWRGPRTMSHRRSRRASSSRRPAGQARRRRRHPVLHRPAAGGPSAFLDYHLVDDRFLPNGCMAASGSLLVWFRDQFAPGVVRGAGPGGIAGAGGSDGLVALPTSWARRRPCSTPTPVARSWASR